MSKAPAYETKRPFNNPDIQRIYRAIVPPGVSPDDANTMGGLISAYDDQVCKLIESVQHHSMTLNLPLSDDQIYRHFEQFMLQADNKEAHDRLVDAVSSPPYQVSASTLNDLMRNKQIYQLDHRTMTSQNMMTNLKAGGGLAWADPRPEAGMPARWREMSIRLREISQLIEDEDIADEIDCIADEVEILEDARWMPGARGRMG